jgi:hypothetical protein
MSRFPWNSSAEVMNCGKLVAGFRSADVTPMCLMRSDKGWHLMSVNVENSSWIAHLKQ